MPWIYLSMAIVLEIVGTTALKASDGFSRLGPSVLCLLTYGGSFFLLSLALRAIPMGVAYAIWAAAGIVCISIAGAVIFGQRMDAWGVVGIGLIVSGVVVLRLFSSSGGG